MNFRDNNNLKAKVISAFSPSALEKSVNKFCDGVDVIDLQYSTHAMTTWNGTNSESWSVFIIYREK